MELKDEVYDKIVMLSNEGDDLFANGQHKEAVKKYHMALDLIPNPKSNWEATTWLYAAIGDVAFDEGDWQGAKQNFTNAMNAPEGHVNPFILLRLGQCWYELGELDRASEYLLRAYLLEGDVIFEDEDDKYFHHIEPLI